MYDIELTHMLNELMNKYHPSIHLKIIREMINMESDEDKKRYLTSFFFQKLGEQRRNLMLPLSERAQLPKGKMNKDLN